MADTLIQPDSSKQSADKPLTKKEKKALRRQEKKQQLEKASKKSSNKRLILWLSVILALTLTVISIIYLSNAKSSNNQNLEPITIESLSDTDTNIKGNREASVVLIEYSDFECPACAGYSTILNELANEFKDRIVIVYRHFPLKTIHKKAELAAWAAEAAAKQGHFWEMHDYLYARQTQWGTASEPLEYFTNYAKELDLNLDQFKADYNSDEVKNKVTQNFNNAINAKLTSTPTFFLNNEQIIDYPNNYYAFRALINQKLYPDP